MEEQLNAGIHTKSGKSLMNAFLRARKAFGFEYLTRSPQGLYNWAACDVTNPNLSPLLSLTFQVISGTSQIFRLLNPRDKKRYYATQYFNFSVTLLRYGLKILTDSWIEGDSLGYPDHPQRRCHPGRQPTFTHFFTNTLKCLHGRLAG